MYLLSTYQHLCSTWTNCTCTCRYV